MEVGHNLRNTQIPCCLCRHELKQQDIRAAIRLTILKVHDISQARASARPRYAEALSQGMGLIATDRRTAHTPSSVAPPV